MSDDQTSALDAVEQGKALAYDDIVQRLYAIAEVVAAWKMHARVLLGGGGALVVQTNCRERTADLDLIRLKEGPTERPLDICNLYDEVDIQESFARQRQFFTELSKKLPDVEIDIKYSYSTGHAEKIVRNEQNDISTALFATILNDKGHGLIVEVMAIEDMLSFMKRVATKDPDKAAQRGRDEQRIAALLQAEQTGAVCQWQRRPLNPITIALD